MIVTVEDVPQRHSVPLPQQVDALSIAMTEGAVIGKELTGCVFKANCLSSDGD